MGVPRKALPKKAVTQLENQMKVKDQIHHAALEAANKQNNDYLETIHKLRRKMSKPIETAISR